MADAAADKLDHFRLTNISPTINFSDTTRRDDNEKREHNTLDPSSQFMYQIDKLMIFWK